MKKIVANLLICTLLLTSGALAAAEGVPSAKKEVIYGILNSDGSVNDLYVVNIFNGGAITDYGRYTEIRNMTTAEELSQNGEQITTNTTADQFYYQGTLDNREIPWDIALKYYLDDKEISAAELAGKNGKLKITMSVKENDNINSSFYNNYALQIALSLDNELCSNIKTTDATIAEAGSSKQLAYTVLPGNGTDIMVTADVHDFEMEAITINGIKLSLGIEVNSDEFTGQLFELAEAIKKLDNGAAELLSGLNQLSSGMQKYIDGQKAFKDGLGQLTEGTDQLNTGATALHGGLSDLAMQNESLVNGALAIQQATFDSVNAQLGEMGLDLPVLTPENYSTVLSNSPALTEVKNQLDGAVQFTQGVQGYTDGVEQLIFGAKDLANGTAELKASSSVIASSASELYNAGAELNKAIINIRDGLASYRAGTKRLRNETSGMEMEVSNEINEMLDSISGSDDEVISFVSEKNTNVSAVQFVLKTASINLPAAEKTVASKPAELSFWKLFSFN
ncbi:MAG: hypothetical protein NUK65_03360 [Firmicutes bacterium]|nr:hypothetical protein [Bacillota bacterium]